MKNSILFYCVFFFFLSFPLAALDWPSPSGSIINNFGWNDGGRPVLGINFRARGDITAAENGELLFQKGTGGVSLNESLSNPARLPSPLGAWTALDHGNGLISVYSRMNEASDRNQLPQAVERGAVVGNAGISGWSRTEGFYFSFYERKERLWLNPITIFFNTRADNRAPVIHSVRLRDSEGRYFDLSQTRNLSQGRYMITVNATDTMLSANETPLAPYRIISSVNGTETETLTFDIYSARDGMLMVYRNGLVPAKDVFSPVPGWEIREVRFSRGQATLELIVQDFNGNSRNVSYRLQID